MIYKHLIKYKVMNKSLLLIVLFYIISTNAFAQPEDTVYKFTDDIKNTIEQDTTPWKYQIGANEYAFAGNYRKTRETWDKNRLRLPKITVQDSLYFTGFMPAGAKEYILERSKNEQIIIINEAHTYPNHRTFTHTLLQGLYDNGYRYLGLEALFDTLINERKYPVTSSGYYTKEPEFGNLIHAALNIGFTLFGYDDFEHNGKQREIAQARNIADFIKNHPHSKMLIHCGHDHVIKGTPNDTSWERAMAGRLKEYTHIDPFTIEQTQFSEKSDEKYNHPFIAMVNKGFPVVLRNEKGDLFKGKQDSDQVDCSIIHPVTQYVHGRPDWLISVENRIEYVLTLPGNISYPVMVLAYRKDEFGSSGVPADIIEISNANDIRPLILSNGQYEIIIMNRSYDIVNRQYIKAN